MASHGSNIARINRILCIYTLLKQFKLSKLIEVEKYQHQETTLLQLGAHLWSCILEILVQLSSFSIFFKFNIASHGLGSENNKISIVKSLKYLL